MHPRLQQDLAQFPQILDHTRQLAEDFLAGLQQRSVCPPLAQQQLQPGDDRLAENGEGAWRRWMTLATLSGGHFRQRRPALFWLRHRRGTPAAVAADWLVSVTDQNSQLSHDTIAAAIELAAVTQLKSLLGLPEAFSGSLVSGATMANFAGLAIGRQWLGQQHGVDIAQQAWRRSAPSGCWRPTRIPAA